MPESFIFSIISGIIASGLVYLGDAYHWEGFCSYTGFWGTHYLDSLLYGMGNPGALHTVAGLWFCYAFSGAMFFSAPSILLWRFITRDK